MIRCLAALLLLAAMPVAAAEQLLELVPRPGAVLRLLADQPEGNIKGSVILLAGGNGQLDIGADGSIGALRGNQLVRSRNGFVAAGYAYLLPDIASDLKQQPSYRYKPAFADDMSLLVAEARKLQKPVHVIGTSRGAISAAALFNGANPQQPDSLVITSGMLISYKIPAADSLSPGRIAVPVLLLRHRDDACSVTPPHDAERYARQLKAAPRVDILTLSGGAQPKSDPCDAAHYHGFWGLDAEVVRSITGWLETPNR